MISLFKHFTVVLLLAHLSIGVSAQAPTHHTMTKDGAWCWFSDPRAICLDGKNGGILTGWVKADGSIETALLNPKTGKIRSQVVYDKLEKDDHNNPAFLALPQKGFMTFYAKHCKNYLYYHHNKKASEELFSPVTVFDPIGKEELKKYPLRQVTYANPYLLKKENNRIYCFGRWTGYKPNLMWSDDMGKSFSKSKVFIAEDGFRKSNRPYVKYFSDGKSKIHILFTDGHPRKEKNNSIYYAYYEKGIFWRADGSKICTLDEIPFKPAQATIVYKATKETGRAWAHDIAVDKKGNIAVLYARYPSENEHIYHYAFYKNGKWIDNRICNSGKWFPRTQEGKREREPHYSGGLTLHPLKLNEVFLSRQTKGVFEIEKHTTHNNGQTWNIEAVTKDSKHDNVRPYIPRNMRRKDKTVVLWMENERYVHYTNYKCQIKYAVFE